MKPLAEFTDVAAIEVIFTDIDGTLTDPDGRIAAGVFAAMERAAGAGIPVIPVTGRPAGWCDMIARTWPVLGVIGENGGLAFRRRASGRGFDVMERTWAQGEATRASNRARLNELAAEVLARFPGAALASDQAYREFDLAVDFCEDVPALDDARIDGIVALLEGAGCHVKVSNIHVNAWFGDFDKGSMVRRVAADWLGWDLAGPDAARATFLGDSPNDSPLFALFPRAIGVANVARLAPRMPTLPAFVTSGAGGAGFVEAVDLLLARRDG